jgi:UDPglucose 6-dehydrogenase
LTAGGCGFTTSYEQAAAFVDVHFVCTGTPSMVGGGAADLSQVRSCVSTLAPLIGRPSLIVGKSTVPTGTARDLSDRLADTGRPVELAWNPEFLREGSAVSDTLAPDRIVAGVTSKHAENVLRQVYVRQLEGVDVIVVRADIDRPVSQRRRGPVNFTVAASLSRPLPPSKPLFCGLRKSAIRTSHHCGWDYVLDPASCTGR